MSTTLSHTGYILRGNPVTLVAGIGAALLILVAIVAPSIAPYGPTVSNVPLSLQPPSAGSRPRRVVPRSGRRRRA